MSNTSSGLRFSERADDAVAFLGPILRPADASRLAPEYPLIFSQPSRAHSRILYQENEPVSGAVCMSFDLLTRPQAPLKFGAIGSVGTSEAHRGKGHVGEVLRECERALLADGASLALLWAGLPQVYEKYGYSEFGTELNYLLTIDQVHKTEKPSGVTVPYEPSKDLKACYDLYCAQPVRTMRTVEEFDRLTEIPDMQILLHRRLGKVVAYAILGKGTDFAGVIHEWAGDPSGVYSIVWNHLLHTHKDHVGLISSASRPDMIQFLEPHGIQPIHGKFGMGKILDHNKLRESLSKTLQEHYQLELSWKDSVWKVSRNERELCLTDLEFLRAIFGFRGVSGEVIRMASEMELPQLKTTPPIEFFLWGLDSV